MTPESKLVLGFHGTDSGEPLTGHQRRIAQVGLRLGARFLSVSFSGKSQLMRQASIPRECIDVLTNGVEARKFEVPDAEARGRLRKSIGFQEEDIVVGTVGALSSVKDHCTLLQAACRVLAQTPSLVFLVVGDGPLRPELQRQAAKSGLSSRVVFAGHRADIPDVLATLDIYACTSISEGMSNSILEAMAAGLPIVATDVGDNPRLVRTGVEGFLVPARRDDLLADAICKLARDPELRKLLGGSAQQRARNHDLQVASCNYERYYEKLIGLREIHRVDKVTPSLRSSKRLCSARSSSGKKADAPALGTHAQPARDTMLMA